jgi:hypothetical protein
MHFGVTAHQHPAGAQRAIQTGQQSGNVRHKMQHGGAPDQRIQRYKRQNVPADASAYAYVLDMVVESERVGR